MKSFEVLAKASDQGRAKEFKKLALRSKFLDEPSGKAERSTIHLLLTIFREPNTFVL